nr:DNA ligase 3 [Calliteara abietis nucleopolyhedrovirus]
MDYWDILLAPYQSSPLPSESLSSSSSSLSLLLEYIDSFDCFKKLCCDLSKTNKDYEKWKILHFHFASITSLSDKMLWCRMLLPQSRNAFYINDRKIIKIFANILEVSVEVLMEKYKKSNDLMRTLKLAYRKSDRDIRRKDLSLLEVDEMLNDLQSNTTGDKAEKLSKLTALVLRGSQCDVDMIVRQLKRKLRIKVGYKHVLTGLHSSKAYALYKIVLNLDVVLQKLYIDGFDESILKNNDARENVTKNKKIVKQRKNRQQQKPVNKITNYFTCLAQQDIL